MTRLILSRAQSNSTSSNISKMEVCFESIPQIEILCCAEIPRDRMDITNVLTELIAARNLIVRVNREFVLILIVTRIFCAN